MGLKYYKSFEDLSQRELQAIYDSLKDKVYSAPYPLSDKKSIVLNIIKIDNSYFDNKQKFYFDKEELTGTVKLEPFTSDYKEEKFAKSHHKINLEKIKTLLTADSMQSVIATVSDIDDSSSDSSDEDEQEQELDETIKAKVKTEDKKPQTSKIPIFTKSKRSTPSQGKKSKVDDKAPVQKSNRTTSALKPAK